jgi:hypothetical protein
MVGGIGVWLGIVDGGRLFRLVYSMTALITKTAVGLAGKAARRAAKFKPSPALSAKFRTLTIVK